MALDNPSYFSVSQQQRQCAQAIRDDSSRLSSESPRRIKSDSNPITESVCYSDVIPGNQYLVPNGGKSPRTDPGRRSFRSLLRSFSANAACPQDAQSILGGEPRPSDIAPADHSSIFGARSHRRFVHSRNTSDVRHLVRKKSHESSDNDDVFFTMPLSGNSKRRHSLGAYFVRDKMLGTKNLLKVTTVPSEVPNVDAPKVLNDGSPVFSSPVRGTKKVHTITTLHCDDPPKPVNIVPTTSPQKKKKPKSPNKEMENIIIVSCRESPEGELWAEHLILCFDKMMSDRARQHYKVIAMHFEDLLDQSEENPKLKEMSKAKLQLLITCPRLLNYIDQLPSEKSNGFAVFQVEKVLAMLLGMDDSAIKETHKKFFSEFDRWQRMSMKTQDHTFVDNFLAMAVDILSKKTRNIAESTSFSIIPKKIKPGQNRVIALLNEPLTATDTITVHVEKKGELIPIRSFKKRNPYTLQFDVPDCCLEMSMLVWIKLEKNGVSCGSRQIKCESRLRELDQILRASENPLEFMCQTLGFKTTDRDQLDSWMLTAFQKNIPPNFNLLSSPLQSNNKIYTSSVDEYPTLLHFAARFGLERLCWQLLECPGGEVACEVRNIRHLSPADLAQAHGFPEIAKVLRGFVQMSEFSNTYYYLKNMSEEVTNPPLEKSSFNSNICIRPGNQKAPTTPTNLDASRTDHFSEECLQRLEMKQTELNTKETTKLSESLYQNDFGNMIETNVQKAIEHDYLIQPSNIKVEIPQENKIVNRPKQINIGTPISNPSDFNPTLCNMKEFQSNSSFTETKVNHLNKSNTSIPIISPLSHDSHSIHTPTGQDELAEIIKDFKNNVFSISEVEKLVMDWKNRNETQQSLKEKQEQLNKMREEYDRLQRRIKEDMKRPTPFERVRKMFSKGKSKGSKTNNNVDTPNSQRPNSGLSVHSVSSSSSGRLSTASGVSLGESGTQSDNEDVKMFTKITGSQDAEKYLSSSELENYSIPPPPRPICGNSYQENKVLHSPGMSFLKNDYKSQHHMDTINEREASTSFQDMHYDNKTCNLNVSKNQFNTTNNMAEHNYINMSPA